MSCCLQPWYQGIMCMLVATWLLSIIVRRQLQHVYHGRCCCAQHTPVALAGVVAGIRYPAPFFFRPDRRSSC